MAYVIDANSAELQKQIDQAKTPLLVDFSAKWCGPCQSMAPHLEAFAKDRAATLKVLKVDVDENRAEAARFMVRSIPTLMLMLDGKVLATRTGAMSQQQLAAFVAANIS